MAVAIVSLDLAWIRYLLTMHRSVLGFDVEWGDCGLFLMANVLLYGIYSTVSRRGKRGRFLIGFQIGGFVAALTYACCTWLAPDGVRRIASVVLEPVRNLLFGWVPHGTIEELALTILFFSAGLGLPQLLVAIACGMLARRGFRPDGFAVASGPGSVVDTWSRGAKGDDSVCSRLAVRFPGLARVELERFSDALRA